MALVPIPARYPDIFTCLVALYSCLQLCVAWAYFNIWQWLADTDIQEVGAAERGRTAETKKGR